MGDRCWMDVTCRKRDAGTFESLGFIVEHDELEGLPGCVKMVDDQANYAHGDDLPRDIVYYGTNDHGDDYSAGAFACDGTTYLERNTDGDDDSFVVKFDDQGEPSQEDLIGIKRFIELRQAVIAKLATDEPAEEAGDQPSQLARDLGAAVARKAMPPSEARETYAAELAKVLEEELRKRTDLV